MIGDRAFDRHPFGALDDRRDDRAAQEIAPIKNFLSAAPQRDLEKLVLVAPRELPSTISLDQPIDRGPDVAGFLGQRAVVRQIVRQINPIDFARSFLVRPVHLDLPVDPARTKNRRIDQIRAIRGENNDDVV